MDEKLRQYIEKTRQAGYTDEKLKATLRGSGYSDELIDEALGITSPKIQNDETAKSTNILAILSLVFAFVFPLVGLIMGIIALNKIKKTNEGGKGLAIAGIILSTILLLISIAFYAVMMIAYFGILNPERLVPERCQSSPGFSCLSAKPIVTSSDVTFTLMNAAGMPIKLEKISTSGNCNGQPQWGIAGSDFSMFPSNEIGPTQAFSLKLTGCDNGNTGSIYSETITLEYEETLTGLRPKGIIEIRGKVN